MKDVSRPRPPSSLRSAPYRKRKSSGTIPPTQGTRRAHDASQGHTPEIVSPHPPDRAYSLLCDGAQPGPSRTISSANDEHRSLSKAGGNREVSHAWRHSRTDGSARERSSHTIALSTHADVSSPSLRLPPTPGPLTTTVLTGQRRADSPPPGSVNTFLRTNELPDKPSSAPPLQASFSLPPHPRVPASSADNTNKTVCTHGNGYHVRLVYKGYPFTYDLSALPEDPKGTIALLTVTESDPGAYLLVGAHYRRTGRSRAACAVIRSLLDNLGNPSDVEKGDGDAAPIPTPGSSTVTLVSSGSPYANPIDWTASVFKSAAMRPAMLLLAACELDISREHPDDPESATRASTAYELFRAVYGTVNDAIVSGAIRPQPKNALGLAFSISRDHLLLSSSDSNSRPSNNVLPFGMEPLTRVKELEKELSTTLVAQGKLQEKLTMSNDRLTRAEGKVYALESHSRDMLVQLDAWRDENWELRQQLAESERMVQELPQCAPSVESRVWGRLKDLLLDNLGDVRDE